MKSRPGKRLLNFGSGPASLPEEVLMQASEAVMDYDHNGLSILEIPHRGKLFGEILEECNSLVKELCGLGEDYEILWMHGGGRLQFTMIPMNFAREESPAGYIDSGFWSQEAASYGKYFSPGVLELSSSRKDHYVHLPAWPSSFPATLSYVHFTTNNTIYGTQWPEVPACPHPLIADMSSDIFSRAMAYHHCSMFYACAQKNIGPAGVSLVALKKDWLKGTGQSDMLPPMLQYLAHVRKKSILNTPPVFAIYTSLLMLRWTRKKTVKVIEEESIAKSAVLYKELDRNSLFTPTVSRVSDRSRMNICFKARDRETEAAFFEFCQENGLTGVEGHRTVGGFRVSLYNATPLHAAVELVRVLQEFEVRHQ